MIAILFIYIFIKSRISLLGSPLKVWQVFFNGAARVLYTDTINLEELPERYQKKTAAVLCPERQPILNTFKDLTPTCGSTKKLSFSSSSYKQVASIAQSLISVLPD